MLTTSRPDVHACPECRLTFPSLSALRRHDALDHRPAPDGAQLVAQILGEPHAEGPPPGGDRAGPAVPPTAAGAPARRRTPERWVLLLVLLGIASVTVALEPLALVLLTMASAHWARWHVLRRLDAGSPPEGSPAATT